MCGNLTKSVFGKGEVSMQEDGEHSEFTIKTMAFSVPVGDPLHTCLYPCPESTFLLLAFLIQLDVISCSPESLK